MEEEQTNYTPLTMQILGVEQQLQELDDYLNKIPDLQSEVDEEISDLLHYIENNDLTPKQCVKMIKILKQKRLVRRGLCKDHEIKKVFNDNRNKISIEAQRPFFLTQLHKKAKELNSQYRYRRFGGDITDILERKEVAEQEIKNLLK